MRSSLILGITLFLTVAVTSIVQARTIKSASHTSGSLGSGINACKCGEIVVKAAKVQKPLVYASPQAINEAAITREAVGRFSAGTGSGSMASNAISGYTSGIVSTSSSSSSSSSHSSSSSSSASVGLGKLIDGSYSPFNMNVNSNSDCGCGKKSEPLEVRDLLSSDTNKQIVPSFPPIGDLCYPSKIQNGKLQVTTKVTPAYPSKVTYSLPTPEQVCVQVLNGQIDEAGMRKLGLMTAYSGTSTASNELGGLEAFGRLSGGSAFGSTNSLDEYISSNAGNTQYDSLGGYSSSDSVVRYGSSGSLGGYSSSGRFGGYGSSGSLGGYGSSNNVGYNSFGNAGGYSSTGYNVYGSGISSNGIYGNKIGTLKDVESYRSNFNDFGDELELPKDYSYPRLPADPVSLTLAYKNLFPRIRTYNKKLFVPEDKLAFGHRTIPSETASSKKRLEVPEEKLQILDKPVVELKPMPSVINIGIYDEQEEAKLAELEAIERERINQEEIAEQQQQQGNIITYGDLGYMPINEVLVQKSRQSIDSIDMLNAEDNERGCGPVGPPAPDYIPGNIVINREIVKNEDEDSIQTNVDNIHHYEDNERSDEEDDSEDSTSGIFARLRSSAQKYSLPCGAV